MAPPRFDSTVTLGHLITAVSFLVAAVAGYATIQQQVLSLNNRLSDYVIVRDRVLVSERILEQQQQLLVRTIENAEQTLSLIAEVREELAKVRERVTLHNHAPSPGFSAPALP